MVQFLGESSHLSEPGQENDYQVFLEATQII